LVTQPVAVHFQLMVGVSALATVLAWPMWRLRTEA
jgi:hypothetical protein